MATKKKAGRTTRSKSKQAPWKRAAPRKKGRAPKQLSTAQKSRAKQRAKKAGRPYPNLVDNMREAASKRKRRKKRG